MRANRRPRRPAVWKPTTTVSYHQDAPGRAGVRASEPTNKSSAAQDNQPPHQGGATLVPMEMELAENPASQPLKHLLRMRNLGGLLAMTLDILEAKEYLDLAIRPQVSGVQVIEHGQDDGDGEASPSWNAPTKPGNTLVAVVLANFFSAVGDPPDWTRIKGASSTEVGTTVHYIPNAAQRSGSETFTGDGVLSVRLYEVEGLVSLDGSGAAPLGSGTTVQSGSVLPTTRNTWLLASLANADDTTTQGAPTNGFTTRHTDTIAGARGQIADKLITDEDPSSQSTSATLSASELNAGIIVAFKVAAGSAPEAPGPGILRIFAGLKRLFGLLDDGVSRPIHMGEPAEALVAAQEGRTSTAYGDLATVGPAVTVDVGPSGKVLVVVSAKLRNQSGTALNAMAFQTSGANVVSPSDSHALMAEGTQWIRASATTLLTGLTPGLTTFTAKYKGNAGTAEFIDRRIVVVPL